MCNKLSCSPGGVPGQVGLGFQPPGPVEGVPAMVGVGGWNQMVFKVSSNPNYCMILFKYCKQTWFHAKKINLTGLGFLKGMQILVYVPR